MKSIATVLLLVSAAACAATPGAEPAPAPPPAPMAAPAPAAPAAVNPVGKYEFSSTVNGTAITGAMEITGTPGAYAGRITTTATEPINISGATVDGQTMTVTAETGTGTLTIRMTFAADGTFTGAWALSGDGAPLTGRRTS